MYSPRKMYVTACNAESSSSACNVESTSSSLVRDNYCVGTILSKFFPHAALLYYCICAAEACKCTSERHVRRAISELSCIVLYYVCMYDCM